MSGGAIERHQQAWRVRRRPEPSRRLAIKNEVFVAFDHTLRGKGLGRLASDNPALRQAASIVLHAIRTDRQDLCVSSGWVLLPPRIAAVLSPLSFDLEPRVLNHYPRCELPVHRLGTASTWSQLRAFRRLYAQTCQVQPRGLLED